MSFLSKLSAKYGEYKRVPSNPNEVRFCCPYCVDIGKTPDTKFHLYISLDKKVGYCFRCGKVLKFNNFSKPAITKDLPSVKLRKPRHVLSKLPKTIPITKAPCALKFLQTKFKDVLNKEELLERIEKFNLQFCVDHTLPHLYNRIMIPIYFEGKIVACQFRSIFGQSPKYLSYSFKDNIKEFLFNYDQAQKYNEVWLMEGVFDVIPSLENAVAIFGKDISKPQLKLLSETFDSIVIALDSDAKLEAKKMARLLILNGGFDSVKICNLPEGKDPGDLGQNILDCNIEEASIFNLEE